MTTRGDEIRCTLQNRCNPRWNKCWICDGIAGLSMNDTYFFSYSYLPNDDPAIRVGNEGGDRCFENLFY